MVLFVTATGVALEIRGIARQQIDAYIAGNPAPEPPQVEVKVFGGAVELVDNPEDPAYAARLTTYHLEMAHKEFAMIAQAVTITSPTEWQADPRVTELAALGIDVTDVTEYLRYIGLAEDGDLGRVVDEMLYLSTVTQRGLAEAELAFGIIYQGVALSQHPNPPSDMNSSALYQARLVATRMGYTWTEFCALPGPEQSAAVAQYQVGAKVQWLADRDQERKLRQRSKKGAR